jgi:glycosyltransferase involved in cell wall biosynthesis
MEALALGRPVVATYVGGIPELVVDDVNGWLVPAGDADRLAQAIRECLRAPDARIQTMGQLGRARVLEMHDIARECRRLADLFAGQEAAVPSLASSANELKPAAAHLQSSASEVGPRAA